MLNYLFSDRGASTQKTSWLLTPALLFLMTVLVAACDSSNANDMAEGEGTANCVIDAANAANVCELPDDQIVSGGPPKDGIPSLQNPPLVSANEVSYLNDADRVIGVMLDGMPVAIPHNILWWHEILNYDGATEKIAITYCPLTGSSIVFDRTAIGGAELGVSGLLYQNNLIMFDRNENEALWSQMLTGARCNSSKGVTLSTLNHVEMTWAGWKELHPDTRVVAGDTGFNRNYTQYPYGGYEELNAEPLFEMPFGIDCRRPPKERALGIPGENGTALTFPFGMLEERGEKAVVRTNFEGQEVVVLWDREMGSAVAFRPQTTEGDAVNLSVQNGEFVDEVSSSTFQLDGLAVDGPLAGISLEAIDEAYVAFWFAWPAFHPETMIFE